MKRSHYVATNVTSKPKGQSEAISSANDAWSLNISLLDVTTMTVDHYRFFKESIQLFTLILSCVNVLMRLMITIIA